MDYRRLILAIIILIQTGVIIYSNQRQNSVLKHTIQTMEMQDGVIKYQARVIEQLRDECADMQNRVAFQ